MHLRGLPIGAQHKLCVGGDRDPAAPARFVPDAEALYANRISQFFLYRHKGQQSLLERMAVVLEFRVALPVPDAISIQFAYG